MGEKKLQGCTNPPLSRHFCLIAWFRGRPNSSHRQIFFTLYACMAACQICSRKEPFTILQFHKGEHSYYYQPCLSPLPALPLSTMNHLTMLPICSNFPFPKIHRIPYTPSGTVTGPDEWGWTRPLAMEILCLFLMQIVWLDLPY